MQLHDFNGGIQPSGLFWIVQVPDNALDIEGDTAELNVQHASVLDDFQFFGPVFVPATVSIHMKWTATGDVHEHEPGSSGPTDPAHFDGDFRPAVATGTFSGSELGFAFTARASSESTFAEMGHERNGVFLK